MANLLPRVPFVKLSFAGPRFEGARLPADASANLAIYQKILVELAKQIWREENPNRLRLPRNFERYFQLQLGKIEFGSAVANLPRFEEDLPELFGDMAPGDIFDKAQDKLVEIIDAANDNRPIPRLAVSVRNELKQLRKNLRSGENFIITRGRKSRDEDRHPITTETKERLTREIREERLENIAGYGILNGVSESPAEISIVSEHGHLKIDVNTETARKVYGGKLGKLVDFNVNAIVDYDDNVKSLEAVNAFSLVEDDEHMARAADRVSNLAGLETGWHNGDGEEISSLTILTARDLARFIVASIPTAGIFPSLDGEIQIEYNKRNLEWTVIIRDLHVIVEVLNLAEDETLTQRFKGKSPNLLRMLLSENGVLDE